MVTEWLMRLLDTVVTTILGWLPTMALPEYLGTGDGTLAGTLGGFLGSVGSLDAWVPMVALTGAAGVVLAAFLASVGVKVVRILASFLTAGGGSAA